MPKSPLICGLACASLATAAFADVVINELVAVDSGRQLRWDPDDQPYAGCGPAWWSADFDDSAWSSGALPMGYSLGSIATNLSSKLSNVSPSFYTRKVFAVSGGDAGSGRPLVLRINYNDGFVAWLNGKEVARGNMGADKAHIYHDQLAYRSNGSSTAFENFSLGTASALLDSGDNVLAVQVNNYSLSGNMRLDLELAIDEAAGADTVLLAPGASVRYLPGLIEPAADVYEPALLDSPALDNEVSDWVELHNDGPAAVDLSGWTLTDDASAPAKWTFPPGTSIAAGGYLLVLADNPAAPIPGATYPHANFKLGANGDYLGLFDAGLNAIDAIAPEYPKQYPYHSYGRTAGGGFVYFGTPTPGAENAGATFTGRADAPDFDNEGGFYTGPVTVTLSSQTPGATIRYTTDGTEPTLSNGATYTAPLLLNPVHSRKGHVIRARTFLAGLVPSNTKTHTFLINQDARLRTSPALVYAGDTQRSLYDPYGALAINGGSYPNSQWQPTGIADYNNVINRGRAYERPIHAEFYFPDGGVGFRTEVGLRAAASSYSRPRMVLSQLNALPWPASAVQKPSFNLYFRSEYGNPSVKLPLNGLDHPVDTYERFRVRAGKNDINNPFVIDEMVRRMSRDMGNGASIGVINSLYVNGELKGFYNLVERLREPFFRSLHSADPNAQWDVLQLQGGGSNVAEGDMAAFDDMISRLNASTTTANWGRVLEVADVASMADYYLLNIYFATWDWPHNNWVAAKERSPAGRYRLYVWDAEGAMNNRGNRPVSQEMINSFIANGSGELRDLWRGLNRWGEFRLLFADRVHQHLFNGGVLDDRDYENSHSKALMDQLVAEFADLLSIMGGGTVNTNAPRNWASEATGRRRYMLGPAREEFRDNGLWPTTAPPEFSQFGGSVPAGFALNLTNASGDIYYTTDGSDPRLAGGAPDPGAVSQPGSKLDIALIPLESDWKYSDTDGDLGTAWREPAYDDGGWASGPAPLGYGGIRNPTLTVPIATTINPQPRQLTVYFRGAFEIDEPEAFLSLDLKIRLDAGAVVYLNGVEAFRDSNIPAGATYATPASNDSSDNNEADLDEYPLAPGLLVDGVNIVAVELHNSSVNSSDSVMDLQLDATRTNPGSPPLIIGSPVTVMARSYDNGEWSALTAADFTVETVPATTANLAIAEMLYNPAGPTADELAAGFTDGDQFEFLRLQNIGGTAIDLHGVRFTAGIGIDFSTAAIRSLPPGGIALVVSEIDAFRARYGSGYDAIIAGQYSGRLNNGGENLRLVGAGSNAIHDFSFATTSPWPDLSALDGQSIQIIDPAGDHGDGANWRASGNVGGTPGGALNFAAWRAGEFSAAEFDDPAISGPDADPDGDGLKNFVEFALGTPPLNSTNGIPSPTVAVESFGGQDYLTIEFTRHPGDRAVQISAEVSGDLLNWSQTGVPVPPEVVNPDGTITAKYGDPTPVDPAAPGHRFIRLGFSE